MDQTGEVIEVNDGILTVRFLRPADCERCRACSGRTHQAQVRIPGKAEVGDRVVVRLPDGQVAKASLLAYALPLGGLFAGLIVGWVLGGDIPALIGAAVGLCLSFLALGVNDRRLRGNDKWQPQLVAVEKRRQDSGKA
jgi:positive regulator of sigma E activity